MKKFIALLVFLLAFATSANAITFDPTGGAGSPDDYLDVATWDWAPSSAVAIDGVLTAEGGTFTLLTHGKISTLSDSGGTAVWSPVNENFEITFVAGFSETIVSSDYDPETSESSQSYDVVSSGLNFFEVYIDTDKDADSSLIGDLSAGTGFGGSALADNASQTLLFKGTVYDGEGSFKSDFDDLALLDSFGNDDASAAFGTDPTDQQTVTGTGGTTIYSSIAFSDFNEDYFPEIDPTAILYMIFSNNTNNNIPFAQVDPSNKFYNGTATYYTPNIGNPNGAPTFMGGGPDVLFQMDNSMSEAGVVPEPTTLLLLGFGLIGVAGVTRRKKA